MADAFYVPLDDDRYRSTPATEGPWSPQFQHGGPPTALLVHAIERIARTDGMLTRIAAEFTAPVPVADLDTAVTVVRDGRNVQLLDAELLADGRTVLRARAWWLRHTTLDLPATEAAAGKPPPLPDTAVSSPVGIDFGYARAMEWRVAAGHADQPGPATVWTRLRTAVVAGTEPSGVQRVVAAADSGSGISAMLDWNRWSFLNVDLTVHLLRPPVDSWVCLDSRTELTPAGTGLATTTLSDGAGRIGTAAQSLLVTPR
ncbi:MAG: thioesterase family protein [Micromonosporaceae bacterium]